MRIENNTQLMNPEITMSGVNNNSKKSKPVDLPIEDHKSAKKSYSDNTKTNEPDLKEKAKEMLGKDRKMGSFENKTQYGEATDLQIGPDIRYALTTKNTDYLRRVVWGPLTSAEYREVFHRLNELERKGIETDNILKGKIVDLNT